MTCNVGVGTPRRCASRTGSPTMFSNSVKLFYIHRSAFNIPYVSSVNTLSSAEKIELVYIYIYAQENKTK